MADGFAIYEITIERPNGDWVWRRAEYADFQDACEQALNWVNNTHPSNRENFGARLIRVAFVSSTRGRAE